MKTNLRSLLVAFPFFISFSVLGQELVTADSLLANIARDKLISKGCSTTARLAIGELKVVGTAACAVPEPTGSTKLACAIGLALQNRTVSTAAQSGVTAGCKWVVKNTSDKVVDVTIEVVKEAEASAAEAKAWLNFLNSVDGAIWFVNRMGSSQ